MTIPPIAPILASLRRHRLTTSLLILQVAFTCAIVSNIAAMTVRRLDNMHPVTGLQEANLVAVESTSTRKSGFLQQTVADIAALRSVPGVASVTAVDTLPLTGNSWRQGVRTTPTGDDESRHQVSILTGFPGELDALGLRLARGRDFLPTEYTPTLVATDYSGVEHAPSVIVSQALADTLWPHMPALGQALYLGDHPLRVTGVLDRLLAPALRHDGKDDMTILLPLLPDHGRVTYVARTRPGEAEATVGRMRQRLESLDPERVIEHARTYRELRAAYFRRDVTMIGLLLAAALGLLFVTALGIGGLASFWVQQRYRQIGIRRAIGATRAQIRVHFHAENALIVGAGVVIGCALAVVLNVVLMHFYEVDALPLTYLPVTALAFGLLGQVAVYSPAALASRVPPVVAIRSS